MKLIKCAGRIRVTLITRKLRDNTRSGVNMSREDTAKDIRQACLDLNQLARSNQMTLLAHILEMAAAQADREGVKPPQKVRC